MKDQKIINKIAEKMKEKFSADSSGHDWWHIQRVWDLSKRISNEENANHYVVELGALLHDVADYKLRTEETGLVFSESLMNGFNIDGKTISQVQYIIKNVGFKGGNKPKMETIEGQCVQDADRLDAMGAIGIARCFTFGGWKGNSIYNPEIPISNDQTEEQYKKAKSPQINHFYEKLLLLKDKMNTQTGRKIAEGRHEFMKIYLDRFFQEWEGER